MLDAYQCSDAKLNDMRAIYNTISKITEILDISTIMPPVVVPYYYGSEQSDDGISAFVLLKGGHFTIHTFPERQCYFVDLLYDGFFNADKFTALFGRELPFENSKINNVDRRFCIKGQQIKSGAIDKDKDFGPHYLIHNTDEILLDINKIYKFLDSLPPSINMTPIMRPMVITDNIKSPNFISGMTMIAQSHIALHYSIVSKNFFSDIFSCSFIDCKDITSRIEGELSVKCENVLISRGSKHANLLPSRDEITARYDRWRENI
jgi:S-adenosylmethionine/arginine decarboxylase-like enzyme